MKSGANIQDQQAIYRMANDDKTAEEISTVLGIHESVVKSFVEAHKGKAKGKTAEK